MIFASFIFLFWFLPLFLAVYYLPLPLRVRNVWLILASLGFYGWWVPCYVPLMLVTPVLDWWCARRMGAVDSGARRKAWLLLSITANLGLLGWFKYANLLAATWNTLGIAPIAWVEVVLPIGISFYTFQSMSYTIDVYRGEVRPLRSLLDLLSYVTMFPQLVAGPIVRYRDVQQQVTQRLLGTERFGDGVFLLAIGLAKKVLIADQVAPIVNQAFGLSAPGLVESWSGVIAYAVQIYFDFSGYSDMAIGLGLMVGFTFPVNFRSPYRAHSITEFWRRWHISLSTWLRDYLYVSLGGNRLGPVRTYVNLAVTMLLGGLWHGAQWTFLLWGAWQGAFLILERWLGKIAPHDLLPRWLQIGCTFVIVLLGWAIFRARDMTALLAMWCGMVGGNGVGGPVELPFLGNVAHAMTAVGLLVAFGAPRAETLVRRFHPLVMTGVFVLFLLAVAHLLATDHSPFLYFQF